MWGLEESLIEVCNIPSIISIDNVNKNILPLKH